MSKSQRTKGAGGERELCALLSDAFGQTVKRKLGQARDSGHDIDLPPFRIEVKRRKRIAGLYDWLEQADPMSPLVYPGASKGLFFPVVALRADGKDWLVVMRLRTWMRLAREEIAREPR